MHRNQPVRTMRSQEISGENEAKEDLCRVRGKGNFGCMSD
jgi:hypothetical protein